MHVTSFRFAERFFPLLFPSGHTKRAGHIETHSSASPNRLAGDYAVFVCTRPRSDVPVKPMSAGTQYHRFSDAAYAAVTPTKMNILKE
jgi:hypothetical protein